MNDKRWMLFKQKKNCQFAYKRDIQIFGTNDDLQYILDKYHAVNLDQSNSFLNLEFSLEQPFLALKDNKKFQNQSYFTSKYGDQKIIGEYFLSRDYRSKKIWIGKQKQLFIEYKINRELPIQENETYKAIAFQIQSQILIVGLNNLIKVFKLEEQTFTQQQVIKNHSGDVCCLLFLQNDNSFISGSLDKSLIIWFWDKKGQIYKCKQILKSAVEQKYIIINKQENLLVSGGNNLISFWIYQNSQWLQKQSLNFNSNSIFGLNFNPSQQLIATYSQNHKIILIKNKKNKTENYWFVSLQINIYNFTPSICFIQDFIILFQTINQTSLGLIKINFHANEIEYQTKILINRVCDEQTTFLMQFNQSKKVVINQTGSFLNLILIIQENQVLHHQEISFKSKYISGFMSTDGEFLITLDQDSKIIQIRKYHSN
ncbi:unnamed protein product [Paramecium sonneborni]|uniref:Uncharacterized protein n=1 Tax=Paramecium sonneborni TaxID=65129 RepID=A0A8S1RGL0_9CILI|nr:unnamed protein product [Paramecium sonneborni]